MRKVLLASIVLALIGMLAIGCGDSSKTTPAPPPASAYSFAYLTEVAGAPGFFTPMGGTFTSSGGFTSTVIKDPTTGQAAQGEFWSVSLSLDGKKATFDMFGGTENTSNQWDIFVANVDGTGMTQITNDGYEDGWPQFSPDGTKIIFNSNRSAANESYYQIVIKAAVPGGAEQVLPLPAGVYGIEAPTFSPDGTKVVVGAWGYDLSLAEGGWFAGILSMNAADGSNPTLLTNPYNPAYVYDEYPAYTADGTKIVFMREDESGEDAVEDIYVMNSDGTGVTKLTDTKGYTADPLVVGNRVVFASTRDKIGQGNSAYELYSINLDGTGLTRLTNNSLYDGFTADWYNFLDSAVTLQKHQTRRLHHR